MGVLPELWHFQTKWQKFKPSNIVTAPEFGGKLIKQRTLLILLGFHTLAIEDYTSNQHIRSHFKDPVVHCLWYFTYRI